MGSTAPYASWTGHSLFVSNPLLDAQAPFQPIPKFQATAAAYQIAAITHISASSKALSRRAPSCGASQTPLTAYNRSSRTHLHVSQPTAVSLNVQPASSPTGQQNPVVWALQAQSLDREGAENSASIRVSICRFQPACTVGLCPFWSATTWTSAPPL